MLNAGSIATIINSVPNLTSLNFIIWKRKVMLVLWYMTLDHAIRNPCPQTPTEGSSDKELQAFERLDHSNRASFDFFECSVATLISMDATGEAGPALPRVFSGS